MSHPSTPDETKSPKCSLPSISSLIEAANGAPENNLHRSPSDSRSQRADAQTPTYPDRPSQYPPSPSATASSYPPPSYYGTPSNAHHDPYSQRQSIYPPVPQNGSWMPAQDPTQPQYPSPNGSPTTATVQHHVPPPQGSPYPGLEHQRPLPSTYPPPSAYPADPNGHQISQQTPYLQHHHYFPPSAAAPYPQTQDRYICPTCNKPFSRPSSLKIHTYSHTGEKPYKCKHEGCGKYFSVRSNMKRHEKGCHGETGSPGGPSPGVAGAAAA